MDFSPYIHGLGVLSLIWTISNLVHLGMLINNPYVTKITFKPSFYVGVIVSVMYTIWCFQ